MILGESGTGKSASLRNFKPGQLAVVNTIGKPLPFRSKGFETLNSDIYSDVRKFMKKTDCKSIVIDDAQYLMANEFMRRAREKGYEKFTEIGQNFWELINFSRQLPDDRIVYFLQHTETSSNGSTTKAKTIGKMLDEKVTLEGMFAIVLKTVVDDDGYHFSKNCEDIYNPFSLFNALNAKEYKNFWFSTGTPTFLIELLQEADFNVRDLEGVEATDEEFDAPTEQIQSPIPVLYQSGYLTIKGYDPDFQIYTLAYPNKEVRKGFIENLLPTYVHRARENNTFYVVSFIRDLRKGDIESCLERTRSFFASIPHDLENKTEKHYQTIFYLLFRLMGQYVDVEVQSAIGRADVVLKLSDAIYVFEFKFDGTPEEALAQIDSKQYAIPYQADGRRIVKIGVNFDSATRTIGEWKIVE